MLDLEGEASIMPPHPESEGSKLSEKWLFSDSRHR